jgi:hypothetical protein
VASTPRGRQLPIRHPRFGAGPDKKWLLGAGSGQRAAGSGKREADYAAALVRAARLPKIIRLRSKNPRLS